MVDFKSKKEQQNININNYIINFTIFSFANQAKAVPPLGPVLGQYNVNLLEFCNKFNSLTKDYPEGLQLFGIVKKKIKSKEFELKIKKLSLKVIFEVFLSNYLDTEDPILIEELETIPIELLYDMIQLYSILHNLNFKSSSRLVLSYLSSNVFIKNIEC
jgi:hypothetical protein